MTGLTSGMCAIFVLITVFLAEMQPPVGTRPRRFRSAATISVLVCVCVCAIATATAVGIAVAGMYLNHITAAALLVAIGLAVEDTLHLGIAYLSAAGSPRDRTEYAIAVMLPPSACALGARLCSPVFTSPPIPK